MQLWAMVNLWEYHHNQQFFLQDVQIDPRLDKELLLECILEELGELECIDKSDWMLERHVRTFFLKWAIPIKQLLDTTEYDYNPMLNMEYQITRNLGRNVVRDLGRDIVRELSVELKRNLESLYKYDETTGGNKKQVKTDNGTDVLNNTHSDNDTTSRNGTEHNVTEASNHIEGYKDNEHEDDTVTSGTKDDFHYISAFDQKSGYVDKSHDNTQTSGDENVKGKYHDSESKEEDSRTESERNVEESGTADNVGEYTNDRRYNETVNDNIDTTGTKNYSNDGNEDELTNKSENETTNTAEDETTDTKEDEDTHKIGIDRITYQELVEKQRDVVQFCIINWIIDKFAKELIVGVW